MNEIVVCSIHEPDVEIIGMITPRLAVVQNKGTYALVEITSGCDEVLVVFSTKPLPDPATPEINERVDAALDNDEEISKEDDLALSASIVWSNVARQEMAPLATLGHDLRHAWGFVNSIMTHTGYDVELSGSLEIELYALVADTIAAGHSVTGLDNPPTPHAIPATPRGRDF